MLTVDVGNSSIGVGVWEDGAPGDGPRVTRHDDVAGAALVLDGPAWAISVAPERLAALARALPEGRLTVLRTPPLPLADPRLAATAGSDRLAAALALGGGPGVVVDAGTAVTVDLVDAEGVYQGGYIAAGPAAGLAGLARLTESLPDLDPDSREMGPGTETVAAMQAGAWGLAVGGVDRLVDEALGFLGGEGVPVLATGGWGADWARASRHRAVRVDPVLVHRGIAAWARNAGEP